jgi:hypothetical protein
MNAGCGRWGLVGWLHHCLLLVCSGWLSYCSGVGIARYATETFPPYIAGASLLERRDTTTIRLLFVALIVAQACCAFYYIADGRLI